MTGAAAVIRPAVIVLTTGSEIGRFRQSLTRPHLATLAETKNDKGHKYEARG